MSKNICIAPIMPNRMQSHTAQKTSKHKTFKLDT